MELPSLQRLLYRLVAEPESIASRLSGASAVEFPGIEAIISGDQCLSAAERLGIYATGYFYRLLDCLKEDYPATLAVLGDEAFQRLIADYLGEFPPTEPSISYAGQHLADFIANQRICTDCPFAEDLARLERTTIEVFHGPDAEALDAETMRSIPTDQWPMFELRLHPAVKFLELNWKVSDVLSAVNEKREWSVPSLERSRMIVFRQNAQVYFRALQGGEKRALERARARVTFAEVCEEIAAEIEVDEPAAEINRLFQRWLCEEILVAA
jgi:hypothetical protein